MNINIKKQTKVPVTNAKAEWRKKPDIALSTEKERSEDRDGDEEGEGQEDAAEDDAPLADSFDQSGDQRQSKTKIKQNQSMQSGTGIRFERNSPSGICGCNRVWMIVLRSDGNFSYCGSRFIPLYRSLEQHRRD